MPDASGVRFFGNAAHVDGVRVHLDGVAVCAIPARELLDALGARDDDGVALVEQAGFVPRSAGRRMDTVPRGRGFKSRWSDQENPSFRRLRGIGTAGFSASRGGQGRCTTDLRPGACDTDALPFPSCAGSVLLGTRRSGRMARPSRSKNPSKLIYVGGYIAFVSYQYMKHCLRSFPATNAYRRRKAVIRAIIGFT